MNRATRTAIGAIVTVAALGVGGYLEWDQIPPLTAATCPAADPSN